MGVYYPQASMILRIRWEDFGDLSDDTLKQNYIFEISPRRVSVHINDYTSADTFDCELDYKDFPFDPRAIRSVGVTIAIENIEKFYLSNNVQKRLYVTDENTVFMGFADEDSISFDDQKRTVRLEGRDFTSLLIDRKYLKGTVDVSQPLDVVIKTLLEDFESTKNMQVVNRTGGSLPVLSSFWDSKDEGTGKKNTRKDGSYWDIIQDVVRQAGLICYVELDKLVVTMPRVLYDKSKTKRFIYGRNISQLEFKRKIGRRKGFNVVVRSLKMETKEVLEVKIPAEATPEWAEATEILNKEIKIPETDKNGNPVPEDQLKPAPYMAFMIPNVSNKDQLIKIGQEVYEEVGRQQIEGSFSTKEMETTGADGYPFNLLKLRNGTPLSIEIEQNDLKEMSELASPELREKYLLDRGYDGAVAAVAGRSLARLATPFYTKSVSFTMDGSQGFDCKIEFLNFIETTNRAFGGRS